MKKRRPAGAPNRRRLPDIYRSGPRGLERQNGVLCRRARFDNHRQSGRNGVAAQSRKHSRVSMSNLLRHRLRQEKTEALPGFCGELALASGARRESPVAFDFSPPAC